MSLRALSLGAVLTACVLVPRPSAAAQAARLVLVQEATASACVDEAELRGMVVARLGYDPFSTGAGLTLLVRVALQETSLVGKVEVVDAQSTSRGTREIAVESGRCAQLMKALSLSISIAIDPEAALAKTARDDEASPAAAAPQPPAAPSSEPEQPPKKAPKPAATPRERPATRVGSDSSTDGGPGSQPAARSVYALGIDGISMVGLAPVTAFGAGLHARRKSGRWGLGVGARILAGSGGVGDDAELSTTVAGGQVEGCFEPGVFEYCGLALVGATWARAVNVALPRTAVAALAAFGGRVGVRAPVSGSWSVSAHVELLGVVAPVLAQVDDDTIWTAPPLAGAFGLGISRRFP
jgi:hypothetical protein